MEKIQSFISGIVFLLFGTFFSFYSKRLTSVLIKSSNLLGEAFNIKRELGKVVETIAHICLILFGIIFILIGIRLIAHFFK